MAHSLSAKKRVRQNERRHAQNRAIKARVRTARRAVTKALEANDLETARKALRECQKLAYRAAVVGPLHKNTAARIVGRLQGRLSSMQKAAAPK